MGPGEIVEISGRMNGEQYLKVLKEVMLPSLRIAYPEGEIYFVNDKCAVHRKLKVSEWRSQEDIAPMMDPGVTVTQQPQDNPPLYPDLQHGPPGQERPQPQMVTTSAAVVFPPLLGPNPTGMTCISCGAVIITRVDATASTKTHLIALVLCLIGCWPCACIPYCKDSCKSLNHYCPNCNSYLGAYKN